MITVKLSEKQALILLSALDMYKEDLTYDDAECPRDIDKKYVAQVTRVEDLIINAGSAGEVKSKPEPFLKWLKLELSRSKRNVAYYKKLNTKDEEGAVSSGYSDSDLTGWYVAQGALNEIEYVISKYVSTQAKASASGA